jgi:hypothetical protein
MRFRASDVVLSLAVNVETEEFATAAGVTTALAAEFGASALEIRRADPEGGRIGFTADVLMSVAVGGDEPVEDALRRAVLPVAFAYRLDIGWLEFRGDPGYAELPLWQELECDGYILYGLSAEPGGRQELRRSIFVTRPDFTPRADSDLVVRAHLRVPVADPVRALELCGPEIAATDASFVQIVSARAAGLPEEYCEVALLSAVPAFDGEDAESGVHRVTADLVARLGEAPVELLAVRAGDDPLYED